MKYIPKKKKSAKYLNSVSMTLISLLFLPDSYSSLHVRIHPEKAFKWNKCTKWWDGKFTLYKGFEKTRSLFQNLVLPAPELHTVRKELRKLPCEAVCSAVSSRVRGNFGGKFALRGREDKIKHDWYFWRSQANSSVCAAIVRIKLSSINRTSNPIKYSHGILTCHQ